MTLAIIAEVGSRSRVVRPVTLRAGTGIVVVAGNDIPGIARVVVAIVVVGVVVAVVAVISTVTVTVAEGATGCETGGEANPGSVAVTPTVVSAVIPAATVTARDSSARSKVTAGLDGAHARLRASEIAACDGGTRHTAATYRTSAETSADATCAHSAAHATGTHPTASAVKSATTTAMKASASAAMEPAASATLGRRGSCDCKRCREGERSDYFQICHFNSPY
jgi:hypothetical protein